MSDYFLTLHSLLLTKVTLQKLYLLDPSWLTACHDDCIVFLSVQMTDFFKGLTYYIVDLILLLVLMIDYGDRVCPCMCSVPGEGEGGRAPGQSLQEGFHLVRQSASKWRDVSPGLLFFVLSNVFQSLDFFSEVPVSHKFHFFINFLFYCPCPYRWIWLTVVSVDGHIGQSLKVEARRFFANAVRPPPPVIAL